MFDNHLHPITVMLLVAAVITALGLLLLMTIFAVKALY